MKNLIFVILLVIPAIVFAQINNGQGANVPTSCSSTLITSQDECTSFSFNGGCCLWCNSLSAGSQCISGYKDINGNDVACGSACSDGQSGSCSDSARCNGRIPDIGGTWYYHVSGRNGDQNQFCTDNPGDLSFNAGGSGTFSATPGTGQSAPFNSGSVDSSGNIVANGGCTGTASDQEIVLTCPNQCIYTLKRSSAVSLSVSLLLIALSAILYILF